MSRRQKWRGVPLNHTNIDEYMRDLHSGTSGQYITQGVSFNKDDNFQMNLLKNALISNGSFSGFIKHILFTHFETHGKLSDDIWLPNETTVPESPAPIEEVVVENSTTTSQEPIEAQVKEPETTGEKTVEEAPQEKVVETPPPTPKPRKPRTRRDVSQFVTPLKE